MTDQELIALLSKLSKAEPRSQAGLDSVRTLSQVLNAEPELADAPMMVRGIHGLYGLKRVLPRKMLVAVRTTGDAAGVVAWFRRIPTLLQRVANGGAVKALYGVKCTDVVPLAADIVLIAV